MQEELLLGLKARGCEGRIVSLDRLGGLEESFRDLRKQGLIDEQLYRAELDHFDFRPPAELPEARSVIVVAVPRTQRVIRVKRRGKAVDCVIPPTYFDGPLYREIRELAAAILAPAGYRVAEAALPQKLLAVQSGLAAYGKNNIAYVPGMGSYHALTALYSDLPAPAAPWRPPVMMDACRRCSACGRGCPAGAIDPGRFLLHAERCISYHNEKPNAVPFPDWLPASGHNCLVGCLLCQSVCPQNRRLPAPVRAAAAFTAGETELLLREGDSSRMPPSVAEKLARADISGLLGVLPRNLRALLAPART
jgi:epoxyqueuosine reductase